MHNQSYTIEEVKADFALISEVINEKDFKRADAMASQLRAKYPNQEVMWLLSVDVKIMNNDIEACFELLQEEINFSINADGLTSFVIKQLNSGKYDLANKMCRMIVARYHDAYNIFNVWGVVLKHLKLFEESVEVYQKAIAINPQEVMAHINMGNTYMDWQKHEKALEAFTHGVALKPTHGECLRLQAAAYIALGENERAAEILESALQYAKEHPMIIVDLCASYYNRRDYDKALEVITGSAANISDDLSVLRTKAIVLKQVGRCEEASDLFEDILKKHPNDSETMVALANLSYYAFGHGMKAKHYYNLAYAKDPNNSALMQKMCHFLMTVRNVDTTEGQNLDKAYEIAVRMMEISPSPTSIADAAQPVFLKLLDYDSYDKLGDRRTLMDYWIDRQFNLPTLTFQMSRVETLEDRLYLIDAHRRWGQQIEDVANRKPIKHRVKQRLNKKTRIGFLSSDLRNHPVGYFAWPIVEHLDRSKFEIYCYSFYPNGADQIQQTFASRVESFKVFPEDHPHTIAQSIEGDSLDIMFELGGSTFHNKVDVCAYRPAPVQVSWLGYPHSIGLPTTIDYILVDPYINPKNPSLIIEKPFIMPHTWVSLDKVGFKQTPINEVIPEDRNGYITFGTMNMPHKMNPKLLALWAYIMNMVPNSRFLYVRPETESLTMRNNFCEHMKQYGIAPSRISFFATRVNHLDQYNNMDIALDPFPHTGGTTTCESMWMGLPVVTLVGDAFFERLSYSNLNNAGLKDLCAFNLKEYVDIALNLVADKERRRYLRRNLRQQIQQHPLGQPALFAKHFGETVVSTLGGG